MNYRVAFFNPLSAAIELRREQTFAGATCFRHVFGGTSDEAKPIFEDEDYDEYEDD
jgi:hypothetical protein